MIARRCALAWWVLGLGCGDPAGGSGPDGSGEPTTTDGASEATSPGPGSGIDTSASGGVDTSASGGVDTNASGGVDTDGPAPICPVGPGSGEPCSANADCASTICTIYSDAPPDLAAACAAPAPGCGTRITGTVRDIATQQEAAGIEVRLLDWPDALPDVVSARDGRVDAFATEILQPAIHPMFLQQGAGFTPTASVLSISSNGMANEVHDLWVVSLDAVAAWSAMLGTDPAIPASALPLGGPAGGIVGLVRDASGQPVAGAVVTSLDDAPSSSVRHLAADGTFTAPATSELGLFVILEPSLAEGFSVTLDGEELGGGTAGSISGVVVAMAITIP